jgi:hypothetical protein
MKREHTIQIDRLTKFLQQHNCIFYSPLSQDDTTDWISGNAMVKRLNDSAVWDSTNNMWKFQYVSGQSYNANEYYVKWDLNNTIVQSQMNLTAIAQTYSDTTTDCFYDFLPTRIGLSLATYSTTTGNESESVQVFATVNNISRQKVYVDGVMTLDYNYNMPYNFFNGETGFRIGCPINSSRATTFCMRNFALFADALSLDEISEYFNIVKA